MNFLYTFSRSGLLVGLTALILTALWWVLPSGESGELLQFSILGIWQTTTLPPFLSKLVQFLAILAALAFSHHFIFSRHARFVTFLHVFFFLLVALIWQEMRVDGNTIIASILTLFALARVVEIDFMKDNTLTIFSATLLGILATLFKADFLIFQPILFLLVIIMDGLKARSVLVMIFTQLVSFLSIFGYAYLFDSVNLVGDYYLAAIPQSLAKYNSWQSLLEHSAFIVVLVGAVVAFFRILSNRRLDHSLKEKNALTCLLIVMLLTAIYMMFLGFANSGFTLIFSVMAVAILTVNFTETSSEFNRTLFGLMLFLMIVAKVVTAFLPLFLG